MDRQTSPAGTLRDAIRALKRHQWKSVAFFLFVMTVVSAALFVLPRTYRSEGRFFVRPWLQSVAQDPASTKVQSIAAQDSREVEINSIVEVLKSRSLVEKVVDIIGPATILGEAEPATAHVADGSFVPRLSPNQEQVAAQTRERAVTGLTKSIEVFSPKKSTVIDVRCDADSPELAQKIVSTLLDVYLEEHARLNQTEWSRSFFAQQADLLRQQLSDATAELRDTKNDLGLTSIEGQRQTLQAQIGLIESQIMSTETELAAANAKVNKLEQTIAELPERLMAAETTGFANEAADHMREQLYQLEIREQELRSNLTDEHPRVVAIQAQVADARKILAEQIPERTQTTSAANPARQQLELSLMTEQALAASLAARAGTLHEQRDLVLEEQRTLNFSELRIGDLERKAQLAEANYRTYADKLEEARMYRALDAERISNVKIVQPATYITKPVSPRMGLTLAAAFVVALLGSVLVALLAEYLDPSLKTPAQIEQQLELPVLLSIPRMSARNAALN